MLEVIGYEVKEGIKKSTGKPYKLEIIHCTGLDLPSTDNSYGIQVECVVINLLITGEQPKYPDVGDYIRVYYGRTGYPAGYEIIKSSC